MQQPKTQQTIKVWSASDRDAFIARAVDGSQVRGFNGSYGFHHINNIVVVNEDDSRIESRTKVTDILAKSLYSDPTTNPLSLGLYHALIHRIEIHPKLSRELDRNLFVFVKGSNAYAMYVRDMGCDPVLSEEFGFSDLDIMVCINPSLSEDVFARIKADVRTIVLQCISQHKRMLDHALFLTNPNDSIHSTCPVDHVMVAAFKQRHITLMQEAGFISPFASMDARNTTSRNSFAILPVLTDTAKNVHIELPHFDRCERIPLRRTPLYASYNETIKFEAADGSNREFELYRLRMNNLMWRETDVEVKAEVSEEAERPIKLRLIVNGFDEKVPADFIDVSIPNRNDAELLEFWQKQGNTSYVMDNTMQRYVAVPSAEYMVDDLYKMLYVYDCPENKREKRMRKYEILKEMLFM